MKLTVTDPNLSIEDICWRYLKSVRDDHDAAAALARNGYVEETLDTNRGLADLIADNADIVPIGTIIIMPDVPDQAVNQTVNLWE